MLSGERHTYVTPRTPALATFLRWYLAISLGASRGDWAVNSYKVTPITAEPNGIVQSIHEHAMPVPLMTAEDVDR